MNDQEMRHRFFYAQEAEAEMYDNTVALVVPLYAQLHEMLIDLIRDHVARYSDLLANPIGILDIGFGTGAESLGVARAIPGCAIVGIELCRPMLDAFKEKEAASGSALNRLTLLEGDFTDDVHLSTSRIIEANEDRGPFPIVITAFTFHHLTIDAKLAAYRKVYDLVQPGGIFINGDLFSFSPRVPKEWQHIDAKLSNVPSSSGLTRQAHKFDIRFIERQFREELSTPESERRSRLSAEKLKQLKARWVHHYQTFNILDSAEMQAAMLHRVGFVETGIPFRYWQVGLLYGRRSAADGLE